MFCPKCGAQLPEGTKFCPVCGSPPGAEKKKGVLSIFFKLGTAAAWVIGIRIALVLAPFFLDFTSFFEVAAPGCPTP